MAVEGNTVANPARVHSSSIITKRMSTEAPEGVEGAVQPERAVTIEATVHDVHDRDERKNRHSMSMLSGWASSNGTGRLKIYFKSFLVFSILQLLVLIGLCIYLWIEGKWGHSQIGMFTAGWCALFATLFTAFQIHLHLTTYTNPKQQQKIIRILLIVPVYSVTSFLALIYYKHAAIYINLVRDCYEAFVLYTFFHFMLDLIGGSSKAVRAIKATGQDSLSHPFPLCCLKPVNVNRWVITAWQCCIVQYVLTKPTCTIIAIICKAADVYDEENMFDYHNAYPWLLVVENLSVTIAFTCLFYFYLSSKKALHAHNPTGKFVAIKLVVFLCFWQGMLISLLVKEGWIHQSKEGKWTKNEVATGLQDYLVCVEMLLITFLHKGAFSHIPYLPESGLRSGGVKLADVAHAVVDVRDVHEQTKGFAGEFWRWMAFKLGFVEEYIIQETPCTSVETTPHQGPSDPPPNASITGATVSMADVPASSSAKPEPESDDEEESAQDAPLIKTDVQAEE